MNLQPVRVSPGSVLSLRCRLCGKFVPAEQVLADLDGPAFQAYYCAPCINAGALREEVQS